MWLHIIDTDKFLPGIVEMFEEAVPGQHVFAARVKTRGNVVDGLVTVFDRADFVALLQTRSDWKGVVFNPLAPECRSWLSAIPKPLKVIWYSWGYEAYGHNTILSHKYRCLPKTKKWVVENCSTPRFERFLNTLRGIKRDLMAYWQLRRVDVFVALEDTEYWLYRKIGLLTAKTKYCFGAVDNLRLCEHETLHDRRNILLGNSATATNNHMEAIGWLAELDLQDRKVITPLSYGGEAYRDMVMAYGAEKLGDNFQPVTDYLPLEEYHELIGSCGFVVMNHLRAQAVGNLVIMLMKGAKVMMHDNTAYQAFKKWGVHLYLIDAVKSKDFFRGLTDCQIDENKKILMEKMSRPRVIRGVQELLS